MFLFEAWGCFFHDQSVTSEIEQSQLTQDREEYVLQKFWVPAELTWIESQFTLSPLGI